jgi:hypothetical protein
MKPNKNSNNKDNGTPVVVLNEKKLNNGEVKIYVYTRIDILIINECNLPLAYK